MEKDFQKVPIYRLQGGLLIRKEAFPSYPDFPKQFSWWAERILPKFR